MIILPHLAYFLRNCTGMLVNNLESPIVQVMAWCRIKPLPESMLTLICVAFGRHHNMLNFSDRIMNSFKAFFSLQIPVFYKRLLSFVVERCSAGIVYYGVIQLLHLLSPLKRLSHYICLGLANWRKRLTSVSGHLNASFSYSTHSIEHTFST